MQTAQFMGATADRLYTAYLTSAEHARMTVDASQDIGDAAQDLLGRGGRADSTTKTYSETTATKLPVV